MQSSVNALIYDTVRIGGIQKGQVFLLMAAVEYTFHITNSRTILKKAVSEIKMKSPGSEQIKMNRILSSSLDLYIQMLEGHAEVIVDLRPIYLEIGQATVIPSSTRNMIVAQKGAKVLPRVIESGHENGRFIRKAMHD